MNIYGFRFCAFLRAIRHSCEYSDTVCARTWPRDMIWQRNAKMLWSPISELGARQTNDCHGNAGNKYICRSTLHSNRAARECAFFVNQLSRGTSTCRMTMKQQSVRLVCMVVRLPKTKSYNWNINSVDCHPHIQTVCPPMSHTCDILISCVSSRFNSDKLSTQTKTRKKIFSIHRSLCRVEHCNIVARRMRLNPPTLFADWK